MFVISHHYKDKNNIKRQRLCTVVVNRDNVTVSYNIVEMFTDIKDVYKRLFELTEAYKYLPSAPNPNEFKIQYIDYRTKPFKVEKS